MSRPLRLKLLGEALLHAPFFAFVADGEMRYLAVNDYACRELGYEESELLELTVPDIVAEPLEPQNVYADMVRSGVSSGTAVLLSRSGWEIPIRYTAGQCTTAAGAAPVFLSVGERINVMSHRAV